MFSFRRPTQQTLLRVAHTFVIVLLLAAASPGAAAGQGSAAPVRVYLDCGRCDFDYIRREVGYVDYVRDPQQADVHVFVTVESTGSDGRLYELSFLGRGAFADVAFTFEQLVDRDATQAEERDRVNDALRLGLVPFVGQRGSLDRFALAYTGAAEPSAEPTVDPWRYWVFTAYVGDIELDLETNRTVFDSRWGFYADHVSEDWKLRFRPYFNYDYVRIARDDRDDVTSEISRHGLESYAIRSLGDHLSAGLFGTYLTHNGVNIRHQAVLSPGVEYSLLPYEEATRRAVTVVYRVHLAYNDYFERTIYGETEEFNVSHGLSASVAIRQPWGEVYGGLEGSHYFHDPARRRAEFFAVASVRLFEGLSVRVQGDFEMIRDQLALPAGDATLEEILLQQRELATDFQLSTSVALTYTFGSDLANIVNTRF